MAGNPPKTNFGNKLLSEIFQVQVDIDMPVDKFIKECKKVQAPIGKTFVVMSKMAEQGAIKVTDAFSLVLGKMNSDLKKHIEKVYGKGFADLVEANFSSIYKGLQASFGDVNTIIQNMNSAQIPDLTKKMNDLKDILVNLGESYTDVDDVLQDLNKTYTNQQKILQKTKPTLDDMIDDMKALGEALEDQAKDWITLKETIIGVGGILGMKAFWDLAKDVEKTGASVMLVGRGMEITRGKATELTEDILKMAKAYQVGADEVGEVVLRFAQLGKTEKEIKGLTKVALQYKDVLGLSTEQAVDFIDTQTRILGMSPKGIEKLGSAMMGYAKATRITTEELIECINAHKDFIKLLKKGEIRETAQQEIMAVSSLFKELGVAPSELGGILDSIIDITDEKSYMMLSMFSSFGERARDMVLAGKPEQVIEDMAKNISRKFKGMSQRDKAFWTNYYAQITGIPKSMIIALADTTEENIDAIAKKMKESVEKSKPIQDAWNEWRKTTGKLQERLKDLVNTGLAKFVLPTLTFFGKILNVVVGALSKLIDVLGLIPKPIRVMTFALLGAIAVYTTIMSTFMLFRGTLLKITAMWLEHGKIAVGVILKVAGKLPFLSKGYDLLYSKMGMFGKAGMRGMKLALTGTTLSFEDRLKAMKISLKAFGKEIFQRGKSIGTGLSTGIQTGLSKVKGIKIPFLDKILNFGARIGKWLSPIFSTAGKFILTGLRFIGKIFWTGLRAIPVLGWILLGISLLPLLNKYILEPLIKVFGGEKALEKWKKFWNSIFGWVIDIGKKIWGGIKEGFGSVFEGIKGVFSEIWGSFKEIWGAFSGVFKELKGVFDMILEAFGISKKEGKGFGDVFKMIGKILGWVVKTAFTPLIVVLKVVSFVIKGIAKVIKFFVGLFSDMVFMVKEFLKSHPGFLKLGKTIFMFFTPLGWVIRIVKGLIGHFKIVFKLFKDIFSGKNILKSFGEAFKGIFGLITEFFGFKLFKKGIDWLVKLFGLDKVAEFGKVFFEKVKNIFVNIGKWLYEVLKGIFPFNLFFGAFDIGKSLVKGVKGIFKGLLGSKEEKPAETREPALKEALPKDRFAEVYEKSKMIKPEDKAGIIAEEIRRLTMKKATAPVEEQANLQKAIDRLCNIMGMVADNTKTQVDLKKKELTDKEKELPEPLMGLTDMLANFNTAQQLGG